MCKFNNRLFVFSLICSFSPPFGRMVLAKPVHEQDGKNFNVELNELMALTALLAPQDDYDLHYDQRQKGEENYRLKLDGFVIGVPQEDDSGLLLLTDDLLEGIDDDFIFGSSKNKQLLSTLPPRQASSNAESYQNSMDHKPNANAPLIVEIPAPNKYGEARHHGDEAAQLNEFKIRPELRTRSYLGHLLSLLKRGRRN